MLEHNFEVLLLNLCINICAFPRLLHYISEGTIAPLDAIMRQLEFNFLYLNIEVIYYDVLSEH